MLESMEQNGLCGGRIKEPTDTRLTVGLQIKCIEYHICYVYAILILQQFKTIRLTIVAPKDFSINSAFPFSTIPNLNIPLV